MFEIHQSGATGPVAPSVSSALTGHAEIYLCTRAEPGQAERDGGRSKVLLHQYGLGPSRPSSDKIAKQESNRENSRRSDPPGAGANTGGETWRRTGLNVEPYRSNSPDFLLQSLAMVPALLTGSDVSLDVAAIRGIQCFENEPEQGIVVRVRHSKIPFSRSLS